MVRNMNRNAQAGGSSNSSAWRPNSNRKRGGGGAISAVLNSERRRDRRPVTVRKAETGKRRYESVLASGKNRSNTLNGRSNISLNRRRGGGALSTRSGFGGAGKGASRGGAIMNGQRRRGGGAISAMRGRGQSTPTRPKPNTRNQQRNNNRRNNNKPVTAADLDAQLDSYMGEDVRKARMDSELDAYFSRSGGEVGKDVESSGAGHFQA
eukprot:Protomagalhaensia_wolfi_Nauph_80__2522@NODE_2686_length_1016_cov_21_218014_g2102_i0_p1_GENE_NODE_2686_length_1016_cov_21_218014_g2102_i0NODE_2686_length_1016_cov_21_218014_g2102_i0_p1_ORF_typecomplete_len209_score25_03FoP_duplication/PF13865_6/1_8e04FoP_duplication/PF13865_6/1_4e09FoP_duplication/PF13865_6/3_9_NODE_2686_length_1016_cov_21_218014_g2102_i0298924